MRIILPCPFPIQKLRPNSNLFKALEDYANRSQGEQKCIKIEAYQIIYQILETSTADDNTWLFFHGTPLINVGPIARQGFSITPRKRNLLSSFHS
jgi:hypothetical protein